MTEEKESKSKFPDNRYVDENSPEVKEAIQKLRSKIQGEEGLHLRTDDLFMLRHLYGAHFEVELAFTKIQEYYKLKAQHSRWFINKPVKEYKSLLNLHTHYVFPQRDNKGRRIFLTKMSNVDTKAMTVEDMSILDEMIAESVLDEPETLRNGTAVITDMSGYSYRNLAWLTPSNLKLASDKSNNTVTVESHCHHVLNTSMIVNAAFSLMFPFLSETTKNHVFFHYDDYEDLHKHINPEILPEEYGGTGPPLDYDAVYEKFIYSQEDRFKDYMNGGYAS